MRYGTSYFPSKHRARTYYKAYYGTAILNRMVDDKIGCGDITIGNPPLKPGEKAVLIDEGLRWAIEDGKP